MSNRFSPRLAVMCATMLALAFTVGGIWRHAGLKAQEAKDPKGTIGPAAVSVTPSKVAAVTAYPLGALVTREAEVPAGKGVVELTINPIPSGAVLNSLHAEGSEGLRVLSTRYRARTVVSDAREDGRKLNDELTLLANAREKVEADVKAVQENLRTLTKMEGFMSVSTMQAAEKGALNAEAAITLAKYIKDSRLESSRELIKLEQEVKANQAKAAIIQAKMGGAVGTSRIERDAVIVVDRGNAGAGGTLKLYYLVEQASWRPQYKLRAGKSSKDPVQVEFLASIVQNSGEDWTNVSLLLSTAQPMLNASPPELDALRITAQHKGAVAVRPLELAQVEVQVRTLRSKAQKDLNEKRAAAGSSLFNSAAALDQCFELHHPDSAIQRGCAVAVREGPTVTYRVASKLDVPARSEDQVVEVARSELMTEFYYKSVPIITTQVYRLADFVNKTDRVILPGDAAMYIGNDFVGQMSLPLVAVGESFTAGFGIDPQMQVTRQLVNRNQTTQGGNQTLRYEYRTLVNSFKNEKVKLQVWDRLPRPDSDAVTVSMIKSVPELSTDSAYLRGPRTQNLLRWDLLLDANANGDKAVVIQYEFKMELDKNMTISGLPSAESTALAMGPPASPAEQARIDVALARLSPQDQVLARAQTFCVIKQGNRLGAIGPIQMTTIKNQPVFFCCKGCENAARTQPDETLQKLQNLMSTTAKRP